MENLIPMRICLLMLLLSLSALGGCAVPYTDPTPVDPTHEIDPANGAGFWLYVPSTYRPDRPAPLIISCHGSPPYDVARHHILELKWYAQMNGCILVAPELIATDGIIGDGPTSGMIADEKRILSIISLLGYRYNIDRANVMITGFSGGGFPAYWIGLRHPDVFSMIVARNCNFSEGNSDGWWSPDAIRMPVFVYYGSADPACVQAQSERAITYLRNRGFVVETRVLQGVGHERHPEVAMDFFRKHLNPPKGTFPTRP